MHEHHRTDDVADVSGHRMERIADSTVAKIAARIGLPALLSATVILGGFVLSGMRDDLASIAKGQKSQGDDIAQIKSDVRDVNTRLDAQVIRQVDSNTKHIDKLEDRVQVLERAVPTP